MPSESFRKAMTDKEKDFGIDFDYLARMPTLTLITEIGLVMNSTGNRELGLKMHRADALLAELEGRPDFQRPRTSRESEVVEWLKRQRRGRY